MRHAIVYYHYNDYDHGKHLDLNIKTLQDPRIDADDRTSALHESAIQELRRSWTSRLHHLRNLTNLVTLELNVVDLYCSLGCCRIYILDSLLNDYFDARYLPQHARYVFEGLKTQAELALIKIVQDKMPSCTIYYVPSSSDE